MKMRELEKKEISDVHWSLTEVDWLNVNNARLLSIEKFKRTMTEHDKNVYNRNF